MERVSGQSRSLAWHGWLGLGLVAIFWMLNWTLPGPRTHWGFFPMWLGYCLTIDAFVLLRRGTSLLTRDWRKYASLFLISAPVWWLFELINLRLQNWYYDGIEIFSSLEYFLLATLSFSTVIPAVFGSAELLSTFGFVQRLRRGPVVRPDPRTTLTFFITGVVMLVLLLAWPRLFFPLVWLSLYFILEPVNIWLGRPSLAQYTARGNWRPVIALWLGVLLTAFFWEMWNFFSYPKWIYSIPWANCCHLFEMPALGYFGYLPFALELYAVYHFFTGRKGQQSDEYVQVES
jgi:hypothetical protein